MCEYKTKFHVYVNRKMSNRKLVSNTKPCLGESGALLVQQILCLFNIIINM